jgi:hypothetical protein
MERQDEPAYPMDILIYLFTGRGKICCLEAEEDR